MDVKDARLHRRVVGVGNHADKLGVADITAICICISCKAINKHLGSSRSERSNIDNWSDSCFMELGDVPLCPDKPLKLYSVQCVQFVAIPVSGSTYIKNTTIERERVSSKLICSSNAVSLVKSSNSKG